MSPLDEKNFFLGRIFDGEAGQATTESLLYDPADLTTHAVITGMTGSGKTGLGISILEEAALKGLPAIVIDPKGDLTNLILHFPDQSPQDFEPWIDPEEARRQGKEMSALAQETAQRWKDGLASWGLGKDELLALKNKTQYAIFTPGSTSGIPVNILSSFQSPDIPWEENKEILREKIASSVTALLGLVGMGDIDSLRSREHILLSNLLEAAWSSGRSLDLTELIISVQNPPFDRLGAFPLDSFFPEKERFNLAILLNNFLAAPSFQTWLEGQNLDIDALLFMPDGKPRHSIFYLAHLSEAERMFFVTLLYSAVETWMRKQRGTGGLRMLIYFDEIMGYLPPVANPPSRTVMLRMLKQARAFGVGQVLATQNPVDVDYKALSNAGTWFVGRLQTDQDKQRLLDGLEGAGGGLDRAQTDKMISSLGKRVFLLHNVHSKKDQLLQTRWVLNYLAGPMTRMQIPSLNELAGASSVSVAVPAQISGEPASAAQVSAESRSTLSKNRTDEKTQEYLSVRPAVSSPTVEYFMATSVGVSEAVDLMKLNLTGAIQPEGLLYRPALIAQAELRYYSRKYDIDFTAHKGALVAGDDMSRVKWEDFLIASVKPEQLRKDPMPQAQFSGLTGVLSDARKVKALESDFEDWVYRNSEIKIKVNENLKVYGGPEVSSAEMHEKCDAAAKTAIEAELNKVESVYDKKLTTLEQKIKRQNLEVDEQKSELEQRRVEELGTHGELLLSFFGGRKKSISSSLSKRRMTAKAKSELEQEEQELDDLEKDLGSLEKEYEAAKKEVVDKWSEMVDDISEVPLTLMKKDIFVEIFGVAWQPYYLVKVGDRLREVPAFKTT